MSSMSSGIKRVHDDSTTELSIVQQLRKSSKPYFTHQSTKAFIFVVSNLTEDQRKLIHDVGFGHLLNLNCSSTPKSLVCWLIDHFDCSSKTLKLSNGFCFELNSFVVHKVFGLPHGGTKIELKPSEEASAIIKQDTNCLGDNPTIKEPMNLITPQLTVDSFVRIFLLFTLSTLLCPTSHRQESPRYFCPIIRVPEIKNYNWSLLILDWLVDYIRSPRLNMWTSSVVAYLTNLDMYPRAPPKFCKLPVKDILSTPFALMDIHIRNLPPPVNTATSKLTDNAKSKLSNLTQTFGDSMLDAIRPIVSSYASQYITILLKDQFPSLVFASSEDIESIIDKVPLRSSSILDCEPDENDVALGNFSDSDDENFLHVKKVRFEEPLVQDTISNLPSSNCDTLQLLLDLNFPPIVNDNIYHAHGEAFKNLKNLSFSGYSLDVDLPHPCSSFDDLASALFTVPDIPTSNVSIADKSVDLLLLGQRDKDVVAQPEKHVRMIDDQVITPKESSVTSKAKEKASPIVVATKGEIAFYEKFTTFIDKDAPSEHIFQIENTWIDIRTLALSMRSGCWFNKYAMNSFCKLFNHEEADKLQLRQREANEISSFFFLRQDAELLLNPTLFHQDVADAFTERKLGIMLQNVDHVYILCFVNNQWFLVVASLRQKRFDVLTPEYGSRNQVFINVVIYNFKTLFDLAFQKSAPFSIRQFETIYLSMPKQNFRYDSGIIILRCMQTYIGNSVEAFTNPSQTIKFYPQAKYGIKGFVY
ncbi:hypothetical protein EJB05_51580, partial [Eragrostis curvula]